MIGNIVEMYLVFIFTKKYVLATLQTFHLLDNLCVIKFLQNLLV